MTSRDERDASPSPVSGRPPLPAPPTSHLGVVDGVARRDGRGTRLPGQMSQREPADTADLHRGLKTSPSLERIRSQGVAATVSSSPRLQRVGETLGDVAAAGGAASSPADSSDGGPGAPGSRAAARLSLRRRGSTAPRGPQLLAKRRSQRVITTHVLAPTDQDGVVRSLERQARRLGETAGWGTASCCALLAGGYGRLVWMAAKAEGRCGHRLVEAAGRPAAALVFAVGGASLGAAAVAAAGRVRGRSENTEGQRPPPDRLVLPLAAACTGLWTFAAAVGDKSGLLGWVGCAWVPLVPLAAALLHRVGVKASDEAMKLARSMAARRYDDNGAAEILRGGA